MSIQSLTPPQDITWTRLAYSRDMIDTNFGDLIFAPKWRSSLAAYFYIVPDEETADSYPNSRIVYLKLTCSITGWNPSESLLAAKKAVEEIGTRDDLQRTLWETIVSSGWAAKYWPCLGAIMQIAVYPNSPDGVSPDDYPYIMDFEPKKRELYESVTEGSEILAGSSDKLSTTKGSTNTQELGAEAHGSYFGLFGGSVSGKATWQQVNSNVTDTSREKRETLSHTSSFSQMYQLFNGYHLGTNRALFVVAPRPHTVSNGAQTDFNLINGERKLEGVQEVFLVVHMPKSLNGFCIQAGLDTGHQATVSAPQHLVTMRRKDDQDGEQPIDPDDDPPHPPPTPPHAPINQLVITRRVIQSCGTFDEHGNFHIRQLLEPRRKLVVGEMTLNALPTRSLLRSVDGSGRSNASQKVEAANNLNMLQSEINRLMLDSSSSHNYTPRGFAETNVFKSLAAYSARSTEIPLSLLASKGYISRRTAQLMSKNKIHTLGDLFRDSLEKTGIADAHQIRQEVIENLLK